jgi:pseudouridine-5'-phosphate glycosidase
LEIVLNLRLPDSFKLSSEIARAREMKAPMVALETTVLTHGLPYPENLELAKQLEMEIRSQGAIPATIGVLEGKVRVGMTSEQLEVLVFTQNLRKISRRDFAPAIAKSESGGTTVAGTLIVANIMDIQVFATGGIGGVHREASFDISADLPELSRTPVVVVCAGAKAILDLPATLEYLETVGVPVLGYQTDEFPAFYSRNSGYPVNTRVDSPGEVAAIAFSHWGMGLNSAILVVLPPPEDVALPLEEVNLAIEQALFEAKRGGIRGQEVTPFLLGKVSELTGNASLIANLGLLKQNARLAAQIAVAMSAGNKAQRA